MIFLNELSIYEYCEGFSNFKIILILNENVKNVKLDIIFLLLVFRLMLVEKARVRLVLRERVSSSNFQN